MTPVVDLTKFVGCTVLSVEGLEKGNDRFILRLAPYVAHPVPADIGNNVSVAADWLESNGLPSKEARFGVVLEFWHGQNCCESVTIDQVDGDVEDIIGAPLVLCEESTSNETQADQEPGYDESFTWTFYRFATVNGYLNVRWFGTSNGYYSESVEVTMSIPEPLGAVGGHWT